MNERITANAHGKETPWGRADDVTDYGGGVLFYSTPSHGGFRVTVADGSRRIPAQFRPPEWHGWPSWYEEDCDAHLVVAFIPELFTPTERAASYEALAHWHPEALLYLRRAADGAIGIALGPSMAEADARIRDEVAGAL